VGCFVPPLGLNLSNCVPPLGLNRFDYRPLGLVAVVPPLGLNWGCSVPPLGLNMTIV
jgi:hypothetical protein